MSALQAIVIEDNSPIGALYSEMLRQIGYEVSLFESGNLGLSAVIETSPDVLLLDLELPDLHGYEILQRLTAAKVDTQVVVITGHSSVEAAVKSMRLGAGDFIEKPFGQERLKTTLDNLMRNHRLSQELKVLKEQIQRDGYAGFVGSSLPMQVVYRIIDNAAKSRAAVFVTGESGTGKELSAQAIHERSDRSEGPFIAVNCGAIPRDLFESEVFGHVKGAFSGATSDRVGAAEQADGGTLFLDEIGEMDLDQQVKLLRFIQSGQVQRVGSNKAKQVNVRFVCATNRNPLELIASGTFREDLYYRLNVIPVCLPPLRERDDDVLRIALHMLYQYCEEENKQFTGFSAEVEQLLLAYPWPGNVRQLGNVIHNTVLLADGEQVEASMLPEPLASYDIGSVAGQPASHLIDVAQNSAAGDEDLQPLAPLWKVEKRVIERAIAHCRGNVAVAAAHLGVSASTIYRKKKQWEEGDTGVI